MTGFLFSYYFFLFFSIFFQLTVDEGKRISSAKAYLNSKIIARNNLDIVLNAMVTKVLIRAKTAYGVNFVRLSGYFSKI